eukprot:gnl/MRDRNA2_/MRDRNA2_153820_c0_seq1.p2 gnl/MRDRNA2_/MRDRNA2_153820_c0~~gnl/MRDRNA2_/MRDRNA2_153820_c0_seq1.p2  ORF type:complete len:148 (-),score=20.04 gnl/MRDRNA2_/MRDRNA2_153820_c0_seq1:30-473(-)
MQLTGADCRGTAPLQQVEDVQPEMQYGQASPRVQHAAPRLQTVAAPLQTYAAQEILHVHVARYAATSTFAARACYAAPMALHMQPTIYAPQPFTLPQTSMQYRLLMLLLPTEMRCRQEASLEDTQESIELDLHCLIFHTRERQQHQC